MTAEGSDIVSPKISHLLDNLWRDYQVLGVVAENPIFPIEPLASYGTLLRGLRYITGDIDDILTLQPELLNWVKNREEISVFPLLDSIFEILTDIHDKLENLSPSLQKL
jgi:hypothetical protein